MYIYVYICNRRSSSIERTQKEKLQTAARRETPIAAATATEAAAVAVAVAAAAVAAAAAVPCSGSCRSDCS